MTMATRIALACTVVAAWFGILAPRLEHRIATATLEGPAPFSLQNLRDRIAADTGEPDPELLASMAALSRLQMAEEERVAAIWSLLGEAVIAEAKTQTDALPAPRYAVDPRFFEPMVPEIIRRTIELYGARSEPLPAATAPAMRTPAAPWPRGTAPRQQSRRCGRVVAERRPRRPPAGGVGRGASSACRRRPGARVASGGLRPSRTSDGAHAAGGRHSVGAPRCAIPVTSPPAGRDSTHRRHPPARPNPHR